jgi:hypothetical protein
MTVLFRPLNLNMAACLLRHFWKSERLIWPSVVAMQQRFAYLLGFRPFRWANEQALELAEMRRLTA